MRTSLGIWTAAALLAFQEKHPIGYDDTPVLPGGKWHVHDGNRPQPRVVTPGRMPGDTPLNAPSDAIVLFGGKNLALWASGDGKDAAWNVAEGWFEIAPGTGDLQTRQEFGDCQLHLEWSVPAAAKGESQDRGNSGVFFMGRYEVQVLDSFGNQTYPDGQAAAIYGQHPPLVNACRPPGEWQSYDVVFRAPRFEKKQLAAPATMTVFHNGVLVHDNAPILGDTVHRALATYSVNPGRGPLRLQDHGHAVRYRNVWIRPLDDRAESTR